MIAELGTVTLTPLRAGNDGLPLRHVVVRGSRYGEIAQVEDVLHRLASDSRAMSHSALMRELDRGGQVFYVHNRVETIEAQTEQLRRMLPDARFVVGHGQMPEGALEKVMITFADGDADGDERGNQAVFDRSRTRLVVHETSDSVHSLGSLHTSFCDRIVRCSRSTVRCVTWTSNSRAN